MSGHARTLAFRPTPTPYEKLNEMLTKIDVTEDPPSAVPLMPVVAASSGESGEASDASPSDDNTDLFGDIGSPSNDNTD